MAGLARKAAVVLLRPSRAWAAIADEQVEPAELLLRYAAPLAAIPALCGAVGAFLFGLRIGAVGVRQPPLAILLEAVAGFAVTLVWVYLVGRFAALLAPVFGGVRDPRQGLKLAVYAATPIWIAGVFHLYPSLALPIGLLAILYAGYLLHLGAGVLMRTDPDRTLVFFAGLLLAALVLWIGRAALVDWAAELGGPLAAIQASPR